MPRALRSLAVGLRRQAAELIYSPDYDCELPHTPHDSRRARRVLAWLTAERIFAPRAVRVPRIAALRTLLRVHDEAYVESLNSAAGFVPIAGVSLEPTLLDDALRMHRAMTGGTLLASRWALRRGRLAINLGGGFHHATADRGQGFCVFNDVAVAIAAARAHGFAGRVLVIDLDLHDGDGTRAIYADDRSVHTFSIHNRTLDALPAVESTAVELGTRVGDAAYLDSVRRALPPVLERFAPELVFYLAGADPAEDDRLGDWDVSADGLVQRDRFVLGAVGSRVPLVLTLAGGYGRGAWRHGARLVAGLLGAGDREPPSTAQLALPRFRAAARRLPARRRREDDAESWTLTEADLVGDLGTTSRPAGLLGRFSPHGIELTLERFGVLDKLRARGFREFRVELDLDGPRHTLRLFAEPREPLCEVRVRVNARLVPGVKLLEIEWLMLQDPTRPFSAAHPALPGQHHPGLGMLRDAVSLLLLMCDRLDLDGLVFTPSHYHVAMQSARYLRFLDPLAEARFRALRSLLGGYPLEQATAMLKEGQVRDAGSGASIRWEPAAMLIPLRDELRERLAGPAFERQVRRLTPALLLEDRAG